LARKDKLFGGVLQEIIGGLNDNAIKILQDKAFMKYNALIINVEPKLLNDLRDLIFKI
jgi:hypothetical protein